MRASGGTNSTTQDCFQTITPISPQPAQIVQLADPSGRALGGGVSEYIVETDHVHNISHSS